MMFLSFPFLSFPFLSFLFFLSFSFMPCLPTDLNLLYSAVVSMGILCVPFPTIATCLCPVGEHVPFSRVLFPFLVLFSYDVPFLPFPFPSLPFPFLSFFSFPFLFFYAFFAHWSESAVFCCSFHGHSMCSFPHCSHVFVPCGGTCSFLSYPLPFFCPFLLWCSFPFLFFYALFAHWSKSAVFCCSFQGHSMCSFPHCSHVFVPCGGTCSLLISYPLRFFCPFLLWCSFPFVSFPFMPCLPIDLNLLYSAVVSMGILCVPFSTVATCLRPVGEPVPFSRVLFPFLVLFSYDVPFLSFLFFLSFPFLLCLSFPFLLCLFCIDLNLLLFIVFCCSFHGHSMRSFFLTVATCLCPVGEPAPFYRILFPSFVLFSYDVPFLSFPFLFFYALFAHWSNLLYSAVVSMGILCVPFPTVATCLCPVGEPVPFYRILFPSFVLFSYDVPFLSFPFLFFYALFAHWSKSAVFLSMGILCVLYSHVFVPCGGTCCLFSCPLPFSCPFLLWCSFPFLSFPFFFSFPFLFFYAFFAHWSESAVFCCSFHGHSMSFYVFLSPL